MAKYVEVPRDRIEHELWSAGFTRLDRHGEVVYARQHHYDPSYRVLVYTSVPEHETVARGRGDDAIRVVGQQVLGTRPDQTERVRPVFKGRVYRAGTVEGVLQRMMQRAREAYAACNCDIRYNMSTRKGAR